MRVWGALSKVKCALFDSVYQTTTCTWLRSCSWLLPHIFFLCGDSTMKLSQMKTLLQLIRNIGPVWMIKSGTFFYMPKSISNKCYTGIFLHLDLMWAVSNVANVHTHWQTTFLPLAALPWQIEIYLAETDDNLSLLLMLLYCCYSISI